jgi:hypothetical protein
LQVFDGRDLTTTPRVAVLLRNAPAASGSGGSRILTLPSSIPSFVSHGIASQLEQRKPRRFPIDVSDVVGPIQTVAELRVTLPAGWRAQLPPTVAESSAFGSYRAEYVQQGRELRVTRAMSGRKGIEPPEQVDALIAWLRAVSKDDVKYIVIDTPK